MEEVLGCFEDWFWDLLELHYQTLEQVRQFREEKGKFPSESSKIKEEKVLGRWISSRRGDRRKGKLDKELEKKMEEVLGCFEDWFWDQLDQHYQMLEQTRQFREEKGKFPSKSSKIKEEKVLGIWISSRRGDRRKGKLDKELEKKMEEVLFPLSFKWAKKQSK